jgi:hypothetical protein
MYLCSKVCLCFRVTFCSINPVYRLIQMTSPHLLRISEGLLYSISVLNNSWLHPAIILLSSASGRAVQCRPGKGESPITEPLCPPFDLVHLGTYFPYRHPSCGFGQRLHPQVATPTQLRPSHRGCSALRMWDTQQMSTPSLSLSPRHHHHRHRNLLEWQKYETLTEFLSIYGSTWARGSVVGWGTML